MTVHHHTIDMVLEFHDKFRLINQTPGVPTPPRADVALCRVQLISEELAELEHAVGRSSEHDTLDALCDLQYVLDGTLVTLGLHRLKGEERAQNHSVIKPRVPKAGLVLEVFGLFHQQLGMLATRLAAAEGPGHLRECLEVLWELQLLLDNLWQRCGMMGLKLQAMREVHAANMRKLGPDGQPITDTSGRVVKPNDWQGPRLDKLLSAVNFEEEPF